MGVRPFFWEHPCREAPEETEPSVRMCLTGRCSELTQCTRAGVPTTKCTPTPLPALLRALEHKYLHTDRSIPWHACRWDPELHFSLLYPCEYLSAGTQAHAVKGNLKAEVFPPSVVPEPSHHTPAGASDSSQEGGKGSWGNVEARKGIERVGRGSLMTGSGAKGAHLISAWQMPSP